MRAGVRCLAASLGLGLAVGGCGPSEAPKETRAPASAAKSRPMDEPAAERGPASAPVAAPTAESVPVAGSTTTSTTVAPAAGRREMEAAVDDWDRAAPDLDAPTAPARPPVAAPPGPDFERPFEPFASAGRGPAAAPALPSPLPPSDESAEPLVSKKRRFVKVFYGTNRDRTDDCPRQRVEPTDGASPCRVAYGTEPSSVLNADTDADAAPLEVGVVTVTFPPSHRTGEIERPLSVFGIDLTRERADRHTMIAELDSYGADYGAWAARVRATGRDHAFVYVHGFANTFQDATLRAAQIAYDLDFDVSDDFKGMVMSFSWPSRGETGLRAYNADYDAADEAVASFNAFLDLVRERAEVRYVHVIAHSMGNVVVTRALHARRDRSERVIDELVLAAPDVWAHKFRSSFLRTLPELARRVTLYVSDHDHALRASRELRGGRPRAGERAGRLLDRSARVDGFEAVDASDIDADFLGHGYYASSVSMLSDIYCVLRGVPPGSRPLLEPYDDGEPEGHAWTLTDDGGVTATAAEACRAWPVRVDDTGWPTWLWIGLAALAAAGLGAPLALRRRAGG